MNPPRLAGFILRACLPAGAARSTIPGDLEEEFHEVAARNGHWRAMLWYWNQSARISLQFLRRHPGDLPRHQGANPSRSRKSDTTLRLVAHYIKYAIRTLRRSPGFTAAAAVTVALGIGATTTVFSTVNAVLLEPFEYESPERLGLIWTSDRGFDQSWLSGPEFQFLQRNATMIQSIAAIWPEFYTMTGDGPAEQLRGGDVSGNLFELLGVTAALGRALTREDETSGERVAVLSNAFWSDRFAADPGVLGRSLRLDGAPYTIVGVMPNDFTLWTPEDGLFHRAPDIWVPIQWDEWSSFDNHSLLGLVRLTTGVALHDLDAELSALARVFVEEQGRSDQFRFVPVGLQQDVVDKVRPTLVVLFTAVFFVLVLVCVNVANLHLARAGARENEIAVRGALGASRGALLGQLCVESLCLALAGGALGTAVAVGGVRAVRLLAPSHLPRLSHVGIDATVLGFALFVTVATGVVFGLAPALQLSRVDLGRAWRSGGQRIAGSARTLQRRILVVSQFALAFVLLIAAGLMIKSFGALRSVDPGFEPDRVLTMQVRLPDSKYPPGPERYDRFVGPVLTELRGIPGVADVGVTSHLPFTEDFWGGAAWVEQQDGSRFALRPVDYRFASGGYFTSMAATLLDGRWFTASDRADAPRVVIVDDAFARQAWPAGDAVGRYVGFDSALTQRVEVIGIVRHLNHYTLDEVHKPQWYFPMAQRPASLMSFTVLLAPEAAGNAVGAARGAIARVDADQAVTRVTMMRELVDASTAVPRFQAALLGAFGFVALALAAVGIYGVVAYSVAQQSRAFGVRIALGARAQDVVGAVLVSGLRLAGAGVVLGAVFAIATGRVLQRFLFEVNPSDPSTLLGVAMMLTTVAIIASLIPAWRATRTDPVATLRAE